MIKNPEIEKDLVQWSRRSWISFILVLLALQIGGLFFASTPVRARSSYPKFPQYTLATPSTRASSRPEIDDPLLFATAHRHGFSGQAWMQPPRRSEKLFDGLPAPAFLTFAQAKDAVPIIPPEDASNFLVAPDYHLPPPPATVSTQSSPRSNSLRVTGPIASRGLVSIPELPTQIHNDVLASSVVQVTVDRDGTVISARLAESSGLKKADLDALSLARQARFGQPQIPSDAGLPDVQFGKLIFDWFALDFNGTNGVKR